jgi:diamine N-acetyltransferase
VETHIREATKNDYEAVYQIQRQVHEMNTKERPDHYRMADTTLDQAYFKSLIN